ncbi:hypothetical protein CFELI_01665 [Corynebacterium felinum]|nr:hypothetical protein CFELI_01665 [Corynebacterium felinum]
MAAVFEGLVGGGPEARYSGFGVFFYASVGVVVGVVAVSAVVVLAEWCEVVVGGGAAVGPCGDVVSLAGDGGVVAVWVDAGEVFDGGEVFLPGGGVLDACGCDGCGVSLFVEAPGDGVAVVGDFFVDEVVDVDECAVAGGDSAVGEVGGVGVEGEDEAGFVGGGGVRGSCEEAVDCGLA